MKNKIQDLADKIIPAMIELSEDIYKNPELGYKEIRTSNKVMEFLDKYKISYKSQVAHTGIIATIDSNKKGPHIALICELDAVPTTDHPYSSPVDCAAHTCGHYSQIGVMMSVLCSIQESDILKDLCGKISLIATPSEEFCDLDYRKQLIKEGKIKYMSGKQEMLSLGVFDDVDIVLSCHTMGTGMPYDAEVDAGLNGFICKRAVFHGKAAHAGSYPYNGINALNAANIAMCGINFLRETFKEEDGIRVHFVLTEGGQTVNTVPQKTTLDMYVRAKTVEAIFKTDEKVTRALRAGALATGCDIEIIDTPGYFPLKQDRNLTKLIVKNIRKFINEDRILSDNHGFASGDMGDISMLLPTVEIGTGGFYGTMHGSDFKTEDTYMAYTVPSKYFIDSVVDLLDNDGKEAYKIKNSFKPIMSKENYFKALDNLNKTTIYKRGEK